MLTRIGKFSPFTASLMSVSTTKSEIVEGEAIEFTVDTRWVQSGTVLKYKIIGTATAADFVEGEGTIVASGLLTRFTLTAKEDVTAEGNEQFSLGIYSTADVLIAQSSTVTIRDTSIPIGVGQIAFTTPGTITEFEVPAGVTMLHAVVVGGGGGGASAGRQGQYSYGVGRPGAGGGLRWINNVPVTPGEILLVSTGAGGIGGQYPQTGAGNGYAGDQTRITRKNTGEIIVYANGGAGGNGSGTAIGGTGSPLSAVGASPIMFIGGGNGGNGGGPSSATGSFGGGGGAGGYSGNGGTGYQTSNSAGVGGGGGGGYSNASGGGVGLLGQGLNGRAGTGSVTAGGGGSNGAAGLPPQSNLGGRGGDYGGGASSATNYQAQTGLKGGQGGHGAARIIWGNGRAFPSTQTGNL